MYKRASKAFLFLLLSLIAPVLAFGGDNSEATALSAARNSLVAGRFGKSNKTESLVHAATLTDGSGSTAGFVFNRGEGEGFVVVATGMNGPEVVAIAEKGNFDSMENLPDALREWFMSLVSTAVNDEDPEETGGDVQHADVEPLTTTKWGQHNPYWLLTPDLAGERTETGCVATSLAQLVKYHNYPEQGKPQLKSYYWAAGNRNVEFDFGNNTFDYSLMSDTYNGTETLDDPSAAEVAKLMLACGVAVNMSYGVESSAGTFGLEPFTEWLLYPQLGLGSVSRNFFTLEEWETIIYEEVSHNRPVWYTGTNGKWGHAFLCDGYKDGLFHINWGWEGDCDGYFSLKVLKPQRSDTETSSNFSAGNQIVRGVRRPDAPVPSPLFTATEFAYGDSEGTFKLTSLASRSNQRYVYPAIKAVSVADGSENTIFCPEVKDIYDEWKGANKYSTDIEFTVDLSSLPDGSYELRPCYKLDENTEFNPEGDTGSYPVYCQKGYSRYILADIEGGKIKSATGMTDDETDITFSQFTLTSPLIKGEIYNQSFNMFAVNNGSTSLTRVNPQCYLPGTDELGHLTRVFQINVDPGFEGDVTLSLANHNLQPGDYDLEIAYNDKVFSDRYRFTYHDGTKAVSVDGFRYLDLAGDGSSAILLRPVQDNGTNGDITVPEKVEADGKELVVTEIGPRIFYAGNEIDLLTLPATIKNIAPAAVPEGVDINTVRMLSKEPPVIYSNTFPAGVKANTLLMVPAGSKALYAKADYWSAFANIVEEASDDEFTLGAFNVEPRSTATGVFTLEATGDYFGCQFDMVLPQNLELSTDAQSVRPSETLREAGFTATYSNIADNTYRVVMFSPQGAAIPVTEGGIIEMDFTAADDFDGGIIYLRNVIFSENESGVNDRDVNFSPSQCEVTANVLVKQITVSPSKITLKVDGTVILEITVLPENATDKSYTLEINDTDIAEIDGAGAVKGLKLGDTYLTVTANDGSGVSAIVDVDVVPTLVERIEITGAPESIEAPGEKVKLQVQFYPDDATDRQVIWKVSDTSLATVDADGNLEAVYPGLVSVTVECASNPEIFDTVEIEVIGKEFSVEFVLDGDTYSERKFPYGSEIELPEVDDKEGHTFTGWESVPETMPAEDLVIYGYYRVNRYTVTYFIDGEEYDSRQHEYGSAIDLPEVDDKEGHTFTGWESVPETMPARDIEIHGYHRVNQYTLTFYLNGEVYHTERVDYGSEIAVPDVEVPEGHQFDGWQTEIPETMPARDVDIYGTYSETSHIGAAAAFDEDAPADIYTLAGILVQRGVTLDRAMKILGQGFYIARQPNGYRKIAVF